MEFGVGRLRQFSRELRAEERETAKAYKKERKFRIVDVLYMAGETTRRS